LVLPIAGWDACQGTAAWLCWSSGYNELRLLELEGSGVGSPGISGGFGVGSMAGAAGQ